MRLLPDMLTLSETSGDLSKLPADVVSELQKNIRNGAKDTDQLWANALELTHKAYDVEGVQRPNPDMAAAWKQYEENLQYAVQQLAKYRGMDGNWRMSAAIFHESMQKRSRFRVEIVGGSFGESYTSDAANIDDIIEAISQRNTQLYDMDVKKSSEQSASIAFSKYGIRRNYRVNINKIV
jgi:hypothetical protein